jgi:type I restriction enzyme S subunit
MSSYPQTWTITNLFEVCQPRQWKTISTKELTQAGYTVYGANGVIGFYNQYTHEAPTLMITCRGATCGNLHISKPFSYINGNAMALDHLNESICSMSYLHRFLQARGFDDVISGSAQPQITQEGLRKVDIPIAPRQEQKRIADKLDTVLTRVDAVNTRLARVAPLLKRFRQSVLAAATSGRLTEDWRGGIETSYAKAPMRELAEMRLGKMLDKAKNTGVLVRYLRNVNVRWFGFDLSDLSELRIESHERDGLSIRDGDLLICEGGEPGRCAIWQGGETDLIFQKALHRVRVQKQKLLPEWVAYVLKSLCDSGEITQLFTGSTIKHLTGTALARIEIPLPSLEEQTEIVRRVETLFAFADRLEARLAQAQTAATRLTPALLAKAFRGELVPQDPNDEPAAELLRRLQAERASAPKASTGRGRKAVVQS